MLQYALLHLFGYDLTIDDLKAFRVSFQPTRRLEEDDETSKMPLQQKALICKRPEVASQH